MALAKKLADFGSALKRLEEAYNRTIELGGNDERSFFRDSTIQRFEFTLEIAWKSIKSFLLDHEGIECRSPKGCIREFHSAGYITESEAVTLLQMIDDRNLASHTYHESLADEIFDHIGGYIPLLKKIFGAVYTASSEK